MIDQLLCLYLPISKHGCDFTACFSVLFYKRNGKWAPGPVFI